MKAVVTGSGTLHSGYADSLGRDVFSIYPLSNFTDGAGGYQPNLVPLSISPLFDAYQHLYEEMKLIGMKVQICVTDQVGGATLPSLQIYTAWDRHHGAGEAAFTPDECKNAASNNVATALNNNVAKLSRSIYASDLIEKATWFDSTPAGVNPGASNAAWNTAGANPNMFCPAFFMCFGSPALNAGSEVASVHFSVSVTYYVAFRNPRYGGSSNSKELPTRTVTFADDDDQGDMDDDALERDLARIEAYRNDVEEPAGAAAAAADPAPLERRQRSAASQSAGAQPTRKKKNV